MCHEAIAVSGIIANDMQDQMISVSPNPGGEAKQLPIINGIANIKELADMAEKQTEEKEVKLDVELTIDGEEIWMVPFVKETLKNVVVGAVKALDGYEEGKEIVIKIKE